MDSFPGFVQVYPSRGKRQNLGLRTYNNPLTRVLHKGTGVAVIATVLPQTMFTIKSPGCGLNDSVSDPDLERQIHCRSRGPLRQRRFRTLGDNIRQLLYSQTLVFPVELSSIRRLEDWNCY